MTQKLNLCISLSLHIPNCIWVLYFRAFSIHKSSSKIKLQFSSYKIMGSRLNPTIRCAHNITKRLAIEFPSKHVIIT
jgi:hypothetical protein